MYVPFSADVIVNTLSFGAGDILNSDNSPDCGDAKFVVDPSLEFVIATASFGSTPTAIPTTVAFNGTATVYT